VLAGCAGPPQAKPPQAAEAPYACVLPSEQRMLVAELFFGRNIKGGGFVSENEWANFVVGTIAPNFPDGYTVLDGMGGWQESQTGNIARDPTKVLIVAVKRSATLAGRLNAVIEAYRRRFNQQSVGIITRDSCASFE